MVEGVSEDRHLVMVGGSLVMTLSVMDRFWRVLRRMASGISLKLLLDRSASLSSNAVISARRP
jgi:hypothetical protein